MYAFGHRAVAYDVFALGGVPRGVERSVDVLGGTDDGPDVALVDVAHAFGGPFFVLVEPPELKGVVYHSGFDDVDPRFVDGVWYGSCGVGRWDSDDVSLGVQPDVFVCAGCARCFKVEFFERRHFFHFAWSAGKETLVAAPL